MCVLPSLVSGAPVAVNDTYAVNEDAVLNTSAAALFSANFEPGTNVVGGDWRYLDRIRNNQNGQTTDTYPVDGAGRDWKALNFDVGTSTVVPWGTGVLPLQAGGINAFPGAPNTLQGVTASGPYNVTTYLFRKVFTLNAAQASVGTWQVRHVIDDGAIIYVNGQEVDRVRMDAGQIFPAGPVTTNTSVLNSIADEGTYTTDTVTIPAGLLVAGNNVMAVEVHQSGGSSYTSSDVGIDVQFTPAGNAEQGFVYADDTFGTNRPANASGAVVATGGNPGGMLMVETGKVNNSSGFSGGWQRSFNLAASATVRVVFDWRIGTRGGLEPDEFTAFAMSLNGTRYGTVTTPQGLFLGRLVGVGNGSATLDTPWATATFDVNLGAGDHVLTLGGYTNKATVADEFGVASIDNVSVTTLSGGSGVLANDTGNPVRAELVSGPANGQLVLDASGNFSYSPNGNYAGADSFTYRAFDAVDPVASNVATVAITVNPVNDAPVAVADNYTTNQQVALTVNAADGVLKNDLDVDNSRSALVVQLVTNVTAGQGVLVLNGDGSLVFTPAASFSGEASFIYRVSDGLAVSQDVTVRIAVVGQGAAPVAVNDTYTTPKNAPLVVTALTVGTVTDDVVPYGSAAVPSVWKYLDNGSDQGVAWRAPEFVDTAWKSGGAELGYGNGDEVTVVEDNATPGYSGGEGGRYATTYFRRKFTVSDLYNVTAAEISLLYDDGGIVFLNGAEVARTATMPSAATTLNPVFDFYCSAASGNNVVATFPLPLNALALGENTFAAEIHQTAPTSSDVSFNLRLRVTRALAAGLLANDTDGDAGSVLTILSHTVPANGTVTVNADGTFTYIPNNGYVGSDTFSYLARDNTGLVSGRATVAINVIPGPNVRPRAVADAFNATEDAEFTVSAAAGLLANDVDADGDALTAALVAGPANGTVTVNGDGSFRYVPRADFAGVDTFTYRASDAGGPSAAATVTIAVANVNDVPVSVADAYATDPGVPLNVAAPGVLGNDGDADAGTVLNAVLTVPVSSGSLTLNGDGSFSYVPAAGFVGSVTFAYRVGDGVATSPRATVTIRVNGRPVPVADAYSASEDAALTVGVPGLLGNDTDPDGDPLTATVVTQPDRGTVALQANGAFVYTPQADFNGTDLFTYRANDGTRDSAALGTVTVTVLPVNDAPVAKGDSFGTPLDTVLTVPGSGGVLRNDSDVDGQALSAVLALPAAHGAVVLEGTGGFTYTPEPGFSGVDSFGYRASDGELQSAVVTATVSVGVDLAKVHINEIMYNPASMNSREEFLEILNANPGALDVSGWAINAGVSFVIPAGTVIPGNGLLVIAADPAVFSATYGSVGLLRGGWTGELSDGGERVRLVAADGTVVDEVTYADEGDWAERREETLSGETGWGWFARHDRGGASLELINPVLGNGNGENWEASVASPTPGQPNSVRAAEVAPLIGKVKHAPAIPTSAQAVTVTAELKDEAESAPVAALFWRVSSAAAGAFNQVAMKDDGRTGDGAAGDGRFGGVIPAQAVGTVVEFYVMASDAGGLSRTWPPPGRNGAGVLVQAANAFYQVDEEAWNSNYPIYRLAGAVADVELFHSNAWDRNSDARVNVTLVTRQGGDTEIRYRCGLRVRGAGSRGNAVNNWRLDIPKDNDWNGDSEMNLNVWYTHLGHLASTAMEAAGLIHERSWPVQVRVNGGNRALQNQQYSWGWYIHLQPAGSEYLKVRRPLDSGGNLYKKVRPHQNFTVRESAPGVPSASGYRNDGWLKNSNEGLNDWRDVNGLMTTFRGATAPTVPQMESVINLDYWLRWLAFQTIVNHNETNLSNGSNDDYGLYRGEKDPRFIPLAHDFDTVWGQGGNTSSADPTSPTATVYQVTGNFSNSGERIGALAPLYTNPESNQRFKAQLVELLGTVFLPANFNAMVDNTLGSWGGPGGGVSVSARDNIKNFNATRRDYILRALLGYDAVGQPPAVLTAGTNLPVQSGYPRTTTANVTGLSGTVDSSRVRKLLVGGVEVLPDNYNDMGGGSAAGDGEGGTGLAPWAAGAAVTLNPGINRLTVQALGAGDAVLDSQVVEIWHDDGGTTARAGTLAASETWSAAGGPWQVTGTLTVPSGVVLTIGAGATVYINAGASIQVTGTGRLIAQGTETNRIRFAAAPGAGNWGALDFLNATQESRLAYVDIENAGGTAIGGHNAKCHVNNAVVFFDNTVWGNVPVVQYISFDNSSFVVSNSVFPTYAGTFNVTSAPEMLHGVTGIPAGGYGVFRGNYFGHTWGFNDTIDFTGGNRPGAILQVIGNVFDGATDDCLDLDSTDAWIEGNVFFGVHQDTQRPNPKDTASAISGGQDNASVSEWTIINNLFYDVDHAVLAKNRNRFVFVNNTVSRVNRAYGSGVDIAAINFTDDDVALSALADGQGAYIADNVIDDGAVLVANYNAANVTVRMDGNLFPAGVTWGGPGAGNVSAGAQLATAGLVPPTTLGAGTVAQGMAAAARVRAALVVGPLSPARWTGMFGGNRGGLQPAGVAVGGVPAVPVSGASLTLTVGPGGVFQSGTVAAYNWGYTVYRFAVNGEVLSGEIPVTTPIVLTNLAAGTHTVSVIGRNDAGVWQSVPTVTRPIVVNPAVRPVVINEVLADNAGAWVVGGARPDVIELRNLGGTPVNLEGWSLAEKELTAGEGPRYLFPAGTEIAAGGYLVLRSDQTGVNLDRDGDALYLYSGSAVGAELIDSVRFGYQVTDKSIGRLGTELAWSLTEPTIGAANAGVALGTVAGLRLNEWSAANDFVVENDFVELFNPGVQPVALGGLVLTDDAINEPGKSPLPALSFIGAGGFVRCIADNAPEQGSNHLAFSINRLREPLALLDGAGRVIDQVVIEPQTEDVSQGRSPDGGVGLAFFGLPTPGYSNTTDLTAQTLLLENLRITEMMYNPPGAGTAEFIELRNLSATVKLPLETVKFVNGITFQFAPGTELAAGGMVVISNVSQTAFAARYPGVPFGGTYGGSLSNGGERVRMEIDGYQLGILDFDYGDGWYPVTDGGGASLEIVNAAGARNTWDNAVSWRAAVPNPGLNGSFAVAAGEDVAVAIPDGIDLEGVLSYGSQNPAAVTVAWTRVSGPGAVVFGSAGQVSTTANFTVPGVYVLRLTASGTVAVSDEVTVTVTETYDAWAVRVLGSADPLVTGMSRDPDADGIVNLLEFALGMDPRASTTSGLPVVSAEGGVLAISYTRYAGAGLRYVAEVSDDLVTWGSGTVVESRVSASGATETWRAVETRPTAGNARRYMRVRVVHGN